MAEERFWYLVCYDIRDAKRWRRCFTLLKGYGERLQYSVVRCRLTKRQLEQIRWELEKELAAEDSLMVVGLRHSCTSKLIARHIQVEWIEEAPRFRIV